MGAYGDIGCGDWEFDDDLRGSDSGDKGIWFNMWAELRWWVCADCVEHGGGFHLGWDADMGHHS